MGAGSYDLRAGIPCWSTFRSSTWPASQRNTPPIPGVRWAAISGMRIP